MGMKRAAISASRAKDFQRCPLLFRFRAVDRLPEAPGVAALRGTLVHAVLESLFDIPARERTEDAATAMVAGHWDTLLAQDPQLAEIFPDDLQLQAWLAEARGLLTNYFRMENPRRLEPAHRERLVETEIEGGILLRGYIDRVDVAPGGEVRIVDYKTGKSPAARFTGEALYQMLFYALMVWRVDGVVPARLQLVYLGDGRTLTLDPQAAELVEFEASVRALWERIEATAQAGDFRPQRSPLCSWCSFQSLCPLFGGCAPALPPDGIATLLGVRRREPVASAHEV